MLHILARVTRVPGATVVQHGERHRFPDVIAGDGRVHDEQRIAFLAGHFREARRAIRDGIDLRGYFLWSLMDNFEWAWGYHRRFGLVYGEYASQRRLIKDSGHWYADAIEANAIG